jgi:YHS domain-containing protein
MEGLGSLLLFALFFYLMMRFGCGAHMAHGSHGGHGNHADHGDSNTNHIDPVCGMNVEPDKGYGKMFQGQLYRFCSRSCLDKFDEDPEQYLNKKEGTKN